MVYSRRIESLWPSAGVAMRGMAREYAAGDSRGLGWREFAGTFGCPLGGPVAGRPSGGEWNGSQPGQGAAELGFPGPMLGKMQSEAARRAGDPSGQGEEPPPEGLGGHDLLAQADAGRPAGEVVGHHLYRQPSAVGGESAGRHVVQPDAVLEVPDGVQGLGVVAAVVGLQLQGLPVPVGDEAVIAVAGEERQLGTGRGPHPPDDEPHRRGAGLTLEGSVEPVSEVPAHNDIRSMGEYEDSIVLIISYLPQIEASLITIVVSLNTFETSSVEPVPISEGQ